MITDWWRQLSPRERALLAGGTFLMSVLLLYTLAWQPFKTSIRQLQQRVITQQETLSWMKQAAVEIKHLESIATAAPDPSRLIDSAANNSGASVSTLIDRSARSAGLASALKQVEPQADNAAALRLRLDAVAFNDLLSWLAQLSTQYSVVINSARIEQTAMTGQVNARLIVQQRP